MSCNRSGSITQKISHNNIVPKDVCSLDSLIRNTNFPFCIYDTPQVPHDYKKIPADSTLKRYFNKGRMDILYNYSKAILNYNYVISFIEDEEETISLSFCIIHNSNLTDKIIVAQISDWENGSKKLVSVFSYDTLFTRILYSSTKDWGDHSKWRFDTTYAQYSIGFRGKIVEIKN